MALGIVRSATKIRCPPIFLQLRQPLHLQFKSSIFKPFEKVPLYARFAFIFMKTSRSRSRLEVSIGALWGRGRTFKIRSMTLVSWNRTQRS